MAKLMVEDTKSYLTVTCKRCARDFRVDHWYRDAVYCSSKCEKSLTSKCVICKVAFYCDGEFITCSPLCNDEYISRQKLIPRIPLGKFNEMLCVLCGANEADHHHHIDLTDDNNRYNCVRLCQACQELVDAKPFFWQAAFAILKSSSKIVRKGWGFEAHITNTPQYCLKYLVFYPNKKFSLHFHRGKKESWHCLAGKLRCRITTQQDATAIFVMVPGTKIEITPEEVHQLHALDYSIITEVSTRDFPEDSFRLEKGD